MHLSPPLDADVRNRVSVPFRGDIATDAAPLLGIRTSPAGRHLLLIFRCGAQRKGERGGAPAPLRGLLRTCPAPACCPALSPRHGQYCSIPQILRRY